MKRVIISFDRSSGFLIEFIAGPVIAGFTTASAFTIATTQVKSLLGLKFNADGFIGIWTAVFDHIEETRPWDAIMGLSPIFALIALRVATNPFCLFKHFNNVASLGAQ